MNLLNQSKATLVGQTLNLGAPYEQFEVQGKPDECLACGSSRILTIAYGHLDVIEGLPEASLRGAVRY